MRDHPVAALSEPSPPASAFRTWLPIVGVPVGVWAALPHFLSPPLATTDRVEIADHVIPGLVVIAISTLALVMWRKAGRPEWPMFAGGLAVLLAGLWMAATHLGLVAQATCDEAPWAAAIYHGASAVTVLLFGLGWVWSYWSEVG
jgi:hypothetical protein